jgi:tight adherence protein C
MAIDGTLVLVAFAMTASLILMVGLLATGSRDRLASRMDILTGRESAVSEPQSDSVVEMARVALPKVGATLIPDTEEKRTQLQTRLVYAGLYHRQAMYYFLGVKFLLMIGLPAVGVVAALLGIVSLQTGLMVAISLAIFGMIAPSFWLDYRKNNRQTKFRRALPDALDVLVICLEGGLSLVASLKRVGAELKPVHPLLSAELRIADREVQLGRTAGESLWHMAERTGLEEILSLSSVINQADRFGASLVKSLRVHADMLRLKRQQRAEEMAQKAGTKILFPTLLFIFPAIFVVILGPAVVQVAAMFQAVGGQ